MISDILSEAHFNGRKEFAEAHSRKCMRFEQKCVPMRLHDTFFVGRPKLQIQRRDQRIDTKKAGGKKLPSAFSKC